MKTGNKKGNIIIIIAAVIALLLIIAVIIQHILFGTQSSAMKSIVKLQDGLWAMEYRGDYGFDKYLAQGGGASEDVMGEYVMNFMTKGVIKESASPELGDYGCSVLTAKDSGGALLFGRNYDWYECDAAIVHTVPKNGYESISTCCLDFIGEGEDFVPDADKDSRMVSLSLVYVPLDGMNEKGLCTAILLVEPGESVDQNTDKPDITVTAAIRLILDKATTVDEAIDLISRYDMHYTQGAAHHIAISDASGKSVVLEYINGEMVVTETDVITNHYVTERDGLPYGDVRSHQRFTVLTNHRENAGGVMTCGSILDAMKEAAAGNFSNKTYITQWTLVCDTGSKTANLYLDENFDKSYSITLGKKDWIN